MNVEHESQAYQFGRLVAVVEKAVGLTDRFFNLVGNSPAHAFVFLMGRYHTEVARGEEREELIGSIVCRLGIEDTPFPVQFRPDDLGRFMLGYYQQKAAL